MRYKMSSDISSHAWGFSTTCTSAIFYPSLNHPGLSPPFQHVIFFSHSFHPEHFPFFHPLSISLPIPPTSLLPPSLCLLDISLSPFYIPPPCLSTHFSPSFPCDEWVCLLGAVHIYWAGERTLSVSLALHISIPPLKRRREQEVTVGWEEEGGRGQEIHSGSHHDSSWLGGEHISLDRHSFSVLALEVVEGERNLPYLLTNLSMWWY